MKDFIPASPLGLGQKFEFVLRFRYKRRVPALPASVIECDSTVVVETFNYLEGTSLDSVRNALHSATAFEQSAAPIEIILADVTGDPAIVRLAAEMPRVRYLDAVGLGYDEAKALAAQHARGRIVVYLDCDCIPMPAWFERITAPLRNGQAAATAGFPIYPGGYWSKLHWLMDFGFLLPRRDRAIGCYPSNNSAFLRQVLIETPEPAGPMRCRCYAHAQMLARIGQPVRLVAAAEVAHEPPPFWRERLRQGYDMIAACWVNPDLPEARWLRWGVAAAPFYYARRMGLHRDALQYADQIGMSGLGAFLAVPLLGLARLIDALGMLAALVLGPRARRLVDKTAMRMKESRTTSSGGESSHKARAWS